MARARFIVRGLVQGVNFRATAVREAISRLRPDAVLVYETLAAFEHWLWRGPRSAQVDAVERAEASGEPRYTSFDVSWSPAD